MNTEKHTKKAIKQVDKALGVFSKAINEVEVAQSTLLDGITIDEAEIKRFNNEISFLEYEIGKREISIEEKQQVLESNNELLEKLAQFKPE